MDMRRIKLGHGSEAGFTLIELSIVIVLIGLLLVPIMTFLAGRASVAHVEKTMAALETGRDALIAYAGTHGGCLPFAADFEGGLPDTDATGSGSTSYFDTGVGTANTFAGDLPWADLGLTNTFLDGDGLRLQYYIAGPYAGDGCPAGYRGFQWNSGVKYSGSASDPLYVYQDVAPDDRRMYRIVKTLGAGRRPDTTTGGGGATAVDVGEEMPTALLQVRRGPAVDGGGSQGDVVSSRNVFVLIAPGANRNVALNRTHIRDSDHLMGDELALGDVAQAGPWLLSANTVNAAFFSATGNIDAADRNNDGDDTLLVMSFTKYKAGLSEYGLNMEALCDGDPLDVDVVCGIVIGP